MADTPNDNVALLLVEVLRKSAFAAALEAAVRVEIEKAGRSWNNEGILNRAIQESIRSAADELLSEEPLRSEIQNRVKAALTQQLLDKVSGSVASRLVDALNRDW